MPSTTRPAPTHDPAAAGGEDPFHDRLVRERDRLTELLRDQARGPMDEPTYPSLLAALSPVHEQPAALRAGLGIERVAAPLARGCPPSVLAGVLAGAVLPAAGLLALGHRGDAVGVP